MGQYDDKAGHVLRIIGAWVGTFLLIFGLTVFGAIYFWDHQSMIGFILAIIAFIELAAVVCVIKGVI